jgi:hypothetical protein
MRRPKELLALATQLEHEQLLDIAEEDGGLQLLLDAIDLARAKHLSFETEYLFDVMSQYVIAKHGRQ